MGRYWARHATISSVVLNLPAYCLGRLGFSSTFKIFLGTNMNNISAGNISNQESAASESLVEDDSGHDSLGKKGK